MVARSVILSVLLASICAISFGSAMDSDNAQPISGGQIAGGLTGIPTDSPQVAKLAKYVANKLSEGDNKERKVVEVLKASVQVVSGSLTHLTLKISDGEQERLYKASIWEQPWLNKTEITKLEPIDDDGTGSN